MDASFEDHGRPSFGSEASSSDSGAAASPPDFPVGNLENRNRIGELLAAVRFAAEKHSGSLRKNSGPYINHPIAVAEILANVAGVGEIAVLQAAVLHDVLEDTPTSPEELAAHFGERVCSLVREVTDEMSLPREERRRLQVQGASQLSASAQLIRVADKIANLQDITLTQPADWSFQRKLAYLDWAEAVVGKCRGCNPPLEEKFDSVLATQRALLTNAG